MIIYISSLETLNIIDYFPTIFTKIDRLKYRNNLGDSNLKNKYYTKLEVGEVKVVSCIKKIVKDVKASDNSVISNNGNSIIEYLPKKTFKVLLYASLKQLVNGIISRSTTETIQNMVVKYAKRYIVTNNYNESIDTIDRDSFIKELKRVKMYFENEERLVEFAEKILTSMGISDSQSHHIMSNEREMYDYFIVTKDKTPKELCIEILCKSYMDFTGYYGVLISKDNKIIFDKYQENNEDTKFRVFSLSKPIVGLSIMLLIQMKKLKLTDTLQKFNIDIPFSDKITILHLLQHSSGIYDAVSNIYHEKNPIDLFESLIFQKSSNDKNETKMIDFSIIIDQINKHEINSIKPKNPWTFVRDSNTDYNILGQIINLVSGVRTDEFLRSNIFIPLNMDESGFQIYSEGTESTPYVTKKKIGIKEQQNYYSGNGFISLSLRDYDKFLNRYYSLLSSEMLEIYHKLYYFKSLKFKDYSEQRVLICQGIGDFSYSYINDNDSFEGLSSSFSIRFLDLNLNLIISENYRGDDPVIDDKLENIYDIIDILLYQFNIE